MDSYRFTGMFSLLLIILLSVSACGGEDDGGEDTGGDVSLWDGECTAERGGWEKCDGNRIQWCHLLEGMDPHFHEGLDCEALGFTCVESESEEGGVTAFEAFCVDESVSCEDGEFACVDNTAQNCLDGVMAMEPCGTAHCHEEADGAVCEGEGGEECSGHGHLHDGECHCDENYEVDPDDSTACIPASSFPEMACQVFEENKDNINADHHLDATDSQPGPHAHLDEVMEAHLLAANASNYVHFPVLETGEYVMFLDRAGVVANFYDKSGEELPFSNPGPNGLCSDSLADHFHISATYTGDGSSPEPVITEFVVTSDTEVKFLVMFYDEDVYGAHEDK